MDEIIIPEYYRLGNHLIGHKPRNLVIYGEQDGIFSLSIAIASMRDHQGKAQRVGIAVAHCNPNPHFDDICYRLYLQLRFHHGEENLSHFQEVANVPNFSNNWYGNVNVERGNFPEVPCDVVWFQCFEEIPQIDRIAALMRTVRERQGPGNYLVIEILYCLDPNFVQNLQTIGNIIEEYRFLGQDRRLTDRLFERGAYSVEVGDFLTLVFQKPREDTCKESTETLDPPTKPVSCSLEASKESKESLLFNDEKLLIKVQLKEIVIFGDNNYTLYKALLNLRNKSQEGILFHPSNYHHHTRFALHPIRAIPEPLPITIPCEALYMTSPIKADECTCTYAGKVVCYKCPPYFRRINIKKLTSFMQAIGCKQDNNDYLLILLTRQSQYESLDEKYKETLEGGIDLEGYKFLGEAKELMKKLCDHGFKDELQDEYIKYIKRIIHPKHVHVMAATKLEIPAMKPILLVFQKVQAT